MERLQRIDALGKRIDSYVQGRRAERDVARDGQEIVRWESHLWHYGQHAGAVVGSARQLQSAQVIMDRDTGRSEGFGFVETQAAIAALNGKDVEGRALTVNEARPKNRGGQPGQFG
jgi:hypothetical protein